MDSNRNCNQIKIDYDDMFYCNYKTVKYKKGDTIFLQNQSPQFIYVVKCGVVEEYNINDNGDYRSIAFEIAGGIIPKCWAFSITNQTIFYYRAHTNCELHIIEKADFIMQLSRNGDLARGILNKTVNSLIGAKLQIDALEKPNANEKLLYMTRCFMIAYGKKISNEIVEIQIPLTHQEIANFTGLTRETITLKIDALKKQKILICKNKFYSVNVAKFNNLVDDKFLT